MANSITIGDFSKLCRLCLASDDILPILSIDELDILIKITDTEIDRNDNLPRGICNRCVAQLKVIAYFINTCKRSYDTLQSIALQQNEMSSSGLECNMKSDNEIKSEVEINVSVNSTSKTEVSEALSDGMESTDDMTDDLFPENKCEKEELEDKLGKTWKKSSRRYWQEYELFIKWCGENNVTEFNEKNMMIFFESRAKLYKSPTLWCIYSKLKSTLNIKHNVNIGSFSKLLAFLKQKNDEYMPNASKALNLEDTDTFVNTAPDDTYLMMKVSLIVAMCTGCRISSLVNLRINDVQDRGDIILISVPGMKTGIACVTNPTWIESIRKYIALRPPECKLNRLFLKYSNNKCISFPVGKSKFASMPSKIAKFLNLQNPESYTGRSFRKSSSLLAG